MTLIADAADVGKRLDSFVHERLPKYSRSRVQSWIKESLVQVNGSAERASYSLRGSETIDLQPAELVPLKAAPENIPLKILYEDADVVVIDKAAGMVVHAGAGHRDGTLVNALLHHFGSLSTVNGDLRPGIVHRLDRQTSGVLVVARTDAAHQALAEQFQSREVEKTYLALAHGRMEQVTGRITTPIVRDPIRRTRMAASRTGKGRTAITEYRLLEQFPFLSYLQIKIGTGRTHQIRVHLASLRHPVYGDRLYGAPASTSGLPALDRFFLHAHRLSFRSPSSQEMITVESPLPAELAALLDMLRSDGVRMVANTMKLVVISLAALLLAGAATFALPQPHQDQAPAQDASGTFRSEITRVNMLFTVTDKRGHFVTDLTRGDFTVTENKKPQGILEFTAESDLPLRMAILIDTSGSITDRFRFQQEAAGNFIHGVMREQDRSAVVAFDSSAELVADMTNDIGVLEKAVTNLRPGGGTALYDAIYFACKEKLMKDQPMYKFRRAMVILSDGQDNASQYSRDQALEMAQRADTVIYTISTNISHIETDGDKVMHYFADQTGGAAFFPFEAKDLNQSFENIANELRHQYNLFYRPEPLKNDGLYHNVQIRVKGRKDLLVRARRGYYARRNLGGAS